MNNPQAGEQPQNISKKPFNPLLQYYRQPKIYVKSSLF